MTLPPDVPARHRLVHALERTADLLDILGGEDFKSRAYRAAARSLEELNEETPELLAREFTGIPKVGKGIAAELSDFARSGTFAPLEAAAGQLPPGLLDLLGVRGLGPKKIRSLWLAGIDSLERLREAAESGELAGLKGFGAKSAATILENVVFLFEARQRQSLRAGLAVAEELAGALTDLSPALAGDVRRGLETVRAAELTVTGTPDDVLARLPELTVQGNGVLSGDYEGVPVEIACAPAEARGALDLLRSGEHFAGQVQAEAQARGFTLTAGGLSRGGEVLPTPTEADVFRALDLPFRPAEYREPEHDDLWQMLPDSAELVTVANLRGMIHTHSTWSDGGASIREMAEAAVSLGHEFLGTADHSRAAYYAGGLTIERLRDQLKEIRELQRAGLPIVAGSEVDILDDGSLDFPDDVLNELDYVVVSVHSNFTLDAARQTERLVRAVSHPLVTVLGHATGRLLLRRPGYALDLDAVLAACEANGTVVEINANAARLDLDWREALRWRDRLKFAINTDAHVPGGLRDARYGVLVARKAGLTPAHVVNSLGRAEFLDFVARQRAARGAPGPADRA